MDGMASLVTKGHLALSSFPFTSRPKGPRAVVAAKATPKLETKGKKSKMNSSEKKIDKSKVDLAAIAAIAGKIFNVEELNIGKKSSPQSEKKKLDISVKEKPSKDAAVSGIEVTISTGLGMISTGSDTEAIVSERLNAEEPTDGEESDEQSVNMECNEEEDAKVEGAIMGLDEEEEIDEDMEMFVPPGVVMTEEKPLRRLSFSNIYASPYVKNSRIKQAEFVKSSPSVAECPSLKLPEFAMVGRSNVGKSSLINSLVHRKDLAQTSKKPGKTQLINHYIINNSWYLVDLPGYGYAKVPASIRASWDGFTREFFLQSKSLVCVMLLVDGSIPPQEIDLQYATWLHQNKVPFTLVFTKCDRKKKTKNGGRKPVENVKDFLRLVKVQLGQMPPWILTSCVTKQGKDALQMHMAQMRAYWSS